MPPNDGNGSAGPDFSRNTYYSNECSNALRQSAYSGYAAPQERVGPLKALGRFFLGRHDGGQQQMQYMPAQQFRPAQYQPLEAGFSLGTGLRDGSILYNTPQGQTYYRPSDGGRCDVVTGKDKTGNDKIVEKFIAGPNTGFTRIKSADLKNIYERAGEKNAQTGWKEWWKEGVLDEKGQPRYDQNGRQITKDLASATHTYTNENGKQTHTEVRTFPAGRPEDTIEETFINGVSVKVTKGGKPVEVKEDKREAVPVPPPPKPGLIDDPTKAESKPKTEPVRAAEANKTSAPQDKVKEAEAKLKEIEALLPQLMAQLNEAQAGVQAATDELTKAIAEEAAKVKVEPAKTQPPAQSSQPQTEKTATPPPAAQPPVQPQTSDTAPKPAPVQPPVQPQTSDTAPKPAPVQPPVQPQTSDTVPKPAPAQPPVQPQTSDTAPKPAKTESPTQPQAGDAPAQPPQQNKESEKTALPADVQQAIDTISPKENQKPVQDWMNAFSKGAFTSLAETLPNGSKPISVEAGNAITNILKSKDIVMTYNERPMKDGGVTEIYLNWPDSKERTGISKKALRISCETTNGKAAVPKAEAVTMPSPKEFNDKKIAGVDPIAEKPSTAEEDLKPIKETLLKNLSQAPKTPPEPGEGMNPAAVPAPGANAVPRPGSDAPPPPAPGAVPEPGKKDSPPPDATKNNSDQVDNNEDAARAAGHGIDYFRNLLIEGPDAGDEGKTRGLAIPAGVKLSNADMKQIADLADELAKSTPLTAFDMDKTVKTLGIDEEGKKQLARLTSLKYLNLVSGSIDNSWLPHVKGLGSLQELDLRGTKVTDAGLANLKDMKQLTVLTLAGTAGITDQGLGYIKGLTNLKSLDLWSTGVTDAGLAELKDVKQLESLSLQDTNVNGSGLVHITGPKLRELNLSYSAITDAGLANIAGFTKMEHLKLDNIDISGEGLKHLNAMSKLEILDLSNTPVTDENVTQLAGLQNLKTLELNNTTKFSGAGLKGLKSLENLYLCESAINNAGVASLKNHPNLKQLNLASTKIKGEGLVDLVKTLSNLDELTLLKTPNIEEKVKAELAKIDPDRLSVIIDE